MSIDVDAYLNRIGFQGTPRADQETLREIHWAHLRYVPFENLDIRPLGLPISLHVRDIEAKVVRRRRGGFCYELNGLLAVALEAIGFAVTRHSVQFVQEDGEHTPPFDHLALLVTVPGETGRFFADVGAGRGSPAFPLPFVDGAEEFQPETRSAYRFVRVGEAWRMDQQEAGRGDWKPIQRFTEKSHNLRAFSDRCRYQWADPGSHFVKGPLCTRATDGGRVTIGGGMLIITEGETREETPLPDDAALRSALEEHFGIELPAW